MLLALLTTAAVATARPAPPPLDPLTFFEGRTRGVGQLTLRGRARPSRFTVQGMGVREGRGIRLSQEIRWDDGRLERRIWRMWPTAPGRWAATGTDMLGQGRGRGVGDVVALEWRRRGGGPIGTNLDVGQVLRLRPDGSIDNSGPVRLAGVQVAWMRERIVRVAGRSGAAAR